MIKKIMIVEDEKDLREMLEMYFKRFGWEVHTAEEGYQALSVYEQIKPSIVLTDINMPFKSDGSDGMNGIELINNLVNKYKEDKLLIFVNSGCLSNEMLASQTGNVKEFFFKPTPMTEIIKTIENHLVVA